MTHTVARKNMMMMASNPYIELNTFSSVKSLPGDLALVTFAQPHGMSLTLICHMYALADWHPGAMAADLISAQNPWTAPYRPAVVPFQ